MRRIRPVELYSTIDDSKIIAALIEGVNIDEVDQVETVWSAFLHKQLASKPSLPEHAHWDWKYKAREVEGMPNYVIFGISVESEMQALMMVETSFEKAQLPEELYNDLVYVAFLSTAPWNNIDIVNMPIYRGCGTLLVQEAVSHSVSLGYRGRVGLHSLPQAERFYRDRCGMTDMGIDSNPEHEGLRYFEFKPNNV